MDFSQRLLLLRTEHNIQTTLRQYQRFEKGEQKPGFDNLIRLADCFQVSLDYLAGRSETRAIPP